MESGSAGRSSGGQLLTHFLAFAYGFPESLFLDDVNSSDDVYYEP